MAATEFETVNDDGFIFKVRKRRLEKTDVAPPALEEGQPREDPKPAAEQSFESEKKRKRLLALKAMYEAELNAWEKLAAAAAAPPDLEEPPSNPDRPPSSCGRDPQAEVLKELKIEVENVEEYVKRLQDHIVLAESTYKLCVREIREDANFRPADEIVLALTGQATSDIDVATTQASLGSPLSQANID